ncbi:hypothetical protein JT06_15120 [Desulfobulbus sp. Tol-SR]|nr:hypothetical protein JT06_15120 [Desulfobulbus sp. Tol-SR]
MVQITIIFILVLIMLPNIFILPVLFIVPPVSHYGCRGQESAIRHAEEQAAIEDDDQYQQE